jgi:hypothetical protein
LAAKTQIGSVVGEAVVDACLRGPDLAGADDHVRGLIASLKQARQPMQTPSVKRPEL